MNKQDMLKIQPCVLRVNIHCDGCAHKVQKKLQKIEGVYKVSIDVDKGKVTVSGNVDPATLIKKLEQSGKHAEMWGGQKGSIPMMNNNQFKNFQMEKSHGGKDNNKGQQQQQQQKGGKGQQKGGFQPPKGGFQLPKDMQSKNDARFPGKDKKSVKFNLPEDEEDDEDDDYLDESDDDEGSEDEFGEGFGSHQPQGKVAQFAGHGGKGSKGVPDGHQKGKNGGKANKGGGGKAEKGSRFDMFLKSMLGKGGDKADNGGKHSKKGDKKQESGKNGKKNGGGGFAMDEGKNGSKNGKGGNHGNGGGGKMNGNWNKKMGENFDGFPRLESKHPQPGFNNMNMNMNNMNPGMMGQMPNFHPVQGLARGGGMNAGHFPGGGLGQYGNNPQYMDQMRMMMMMNQQQQQQQHGNGHGAYNHAPPHPLGYNYMAMPPAGMSYGPPPPGSDQYTHMFSDENTGSCSIM